MRPPLTSNSTVTWITPIGFSLAVIGFPIGKVRSNYNFQKNEDREAHHEEPAQGSTSSKIFEAIITKLYRFRVRIS